MRAVGRIYVEGEPFTPGMISRSLRRFSDERLRLVKFTDFQTLPTRQIVPGGMIREIIENERARRRSNG